MAGYRAISVGPLVLVLYLFYGPGLAWAATDLLTLYREARSYDASYTAQQYALEASRELVPQARAAFLPQVGIRASYDERASDVRAPVSSVQDGKVVQDVQERPVDYTSASATLTGILPIFRYETIATYRQAKARQEQGEANFAIADQDLVIRVAEAYFNVLLAQTNLDLIRAQKAALQQQLVQSSKMYSGGVAAITDVHESQTRLDIVVSQEVQGQNLLEIQWRQLAALTGQRPDALTQLGPGFELVDPAPADVQFWVVQAIGANPEIRTLRAATEAARQELAKARAGHMPTLDLIARRGYDKDPSYTNIGITTDDSSIGVQLTVPVFEGGGTSARVRQVAASYRQAQYELEATIREVTTRANEEFLNVRKGVIEVRALERAVFSSESALHSTEMGLRAGMRTTLDVLNAQQQVFQSKRDLAVARYGYVVSRLRLQRIAGELDESHVEQVNRWLG